jgi:hypothetical protein
MRMGRDAQLVARGVDGDAVRAAGQVDAARQAQRAAVVAHGEDEQRVAAAVGDIAEARARAGDARGADAGVRARQHLAAALDRQRPRAAVDDGAQPGRDGRLRERRAGGRRQRGAAAAREERA